MNELNPAAACRVPACSLTNLRGRIATFLALTGALCAVIVPTAAARAHHSHARRAVRGCAHARTRIAQARRPVLQAAVVCLINLQRTSRGLPPLHENARLNRSAQRWTNTMVRAGSFTHGADFAQRITAAGFNWSQAGENIAAGFQTPAAAVRAWMNSPGHCRNILSPAFADIGIGVSAGRVAGAGRRGTWTQDFGLPLGAAEPSHNLAAQTSCPT